MFARAGAVWFGIMLIAILNGALRDSCSCPASEISARARISCLTLAVAILLVTWMSLPWIRPASMTRRLAIGVLWLAMTLAFEFGAGHYLFRHAMADAAGRLQPARGPALDSRAIATLTAPALIYLAGDNPVARAEISSPRI